MNEATVGRNRIRDLNADTKSATKTPKRGLEFRPLDKETTHLCVYADASFASYLDMSSQLGYITFPCDASDQCHIIEYASKHSCRVVRSIISGDMYAFTDAFDAAFRIAKDMSEMLNTSVKVKMFTDSKQVLDVITRG